MIKKYITQISALIKTDCSHLHVLKVNTKTGGERKFRNDCPHLVQEDDERKFINDFPHLSI